MEITSLKNHLRQSMESSDKDHLRAYVEGTCFTDEVYSMLYDKRHSRYLGISLFSSSGSMAQSDSACPVSWILGLQPVLRVS